MGMHTLESQLKHMAHYNVHGYQGAYMILCILNHKRSL